jgi:small subunit ribosomal protein S2
LVSISMKQLLEAGVHFGHQTKRWNPKMKEYIFGERNGIYIIDLQKSLRLFKNAVQFISDLSAQGKTVLFLGTKRQAQEVVQEEAQRCGMYYVNQRWLGGLLTNFATIQKSIKRFRELEAMQTNGQYDLLSKKEVARLERERKKLEKNLSGIKEMTQLPEALFVIDTKKEAIAVQEARKLGIPIVGVADTNCDPDEIDYIIPGNDDALRAIRLIANTISQAFLDGRAVYEAQQKELAEQMEKQRQLQAQQAPAAREAAARSAAAEAARKAAEAKDAGDAAPAAGEGAAAAGEAGGRPKTTFKKTLQRKARPRRSEPRGPGESMEQAEAAGLAEPVAPLEPAAPAEAGASSEHAVPAEPAVDTGAEPKPSAGPEPDPTGPETGN